MRKYLIIVFLCVSLVGCSKKEDINISSDFGLEASESNTESESSDSFEIEDPEFELPTKSNDEIRQEIDAELEQIYEENKEEYEKEREQVEVYDSKSDSTVNILDVGTEGIMFVVDKIKNREYQSLDEAYNDLEIDFEGESKEVVDKAKEQLKVSWNYWEEKHKVMDSEKPWTTEELAENPLRADYTREEYEAIEKAFEADGKKMGGSNLMDLKDN